MGIGKKKIAAIATSSILAVSIVGGSLAWFTSSDSVTNIFATGTTDNPANPTSGIAIWEKFTPPTNIVPGTTTEKIVQVKNTASYDQFVRARIEKGFVGSDGKLIEGTDKYITLKYGFSYDGGAINPSPANTWWTPFNVTQGPQWYYYFGRLPSGAFSYPLVSSVTLASETPNEYKNMKFDVRVYSEGIQAKNGAAVADWAGGNQTLIDAFSTYETSTDTGAWPNKYGTVPVTK